MNTFRFLLGAGRRRVGVPTAVIALALGLSACGQLETMETEHGRPTDTAPRYKDDKPRESIFGEGGLFFGGDKKKGVDEGGSGIGVNSYLWRASLDTISFMPVASADPFGGVIITDWYSPPETPDERFKANVYILGRALRADGVRVSVFREVQVASGTWQSRPVGDDVATDLENAILLRARQLRNETVNQ